MNIKNCRNSGIVKIGRTYARFSTSDGNIVDKYQYVSIFLDIESIGTKTKISINIEIKQTKG